MFNITINKVTELLKNLGVNTDNLNIIKEF